MNTTAKVNTPEKSGGSNFADWFAILAILISLGAGFLIFFFILRDPHNFKGLDPDKGHPENILGTIAKGGYIVPLLIALNITVILVIIERIITLAKASGGGNTNNFLRGIRNNLSANKLDEAISLCDRRKGSLANVIRSGITRYQMVSKDGNMTKDEKSEAIQKELEEATSLELPMLSKNLVIVSTCASIGTLIGLIGTVIGMIRAFSALAKEGTPDTVQLSTGISEALINTAFGIIGSTIAIIAYNYFSNRIDGMTYSMDEAGYTIVSDFKSKH